MHDSRRRFLQQAAAGSAGTWMLAGQSAAGREKHAHEVATTGVHQGKLAPFDELMHDFYRDHDLVGASLAVTRNGRLVYARGFGLADREHAQVVEPNSRFRIASISKPVTAVATLQLVEQGKLALDDKVCKVLSIGETKDSRWQEVTIAQLLQHTGGWDRGKSYDPMFRSVEIAEKLNVAPPAMPEHVIRYMAEQPLDDDPGTNYAYSNFGYCLLGRVIEKLTGMHYGPYVRSKVLAPLGIVGMRLGHTLRDKRAPHEVCYYDRKNRKGKAVMGDVGAQVPVPYGAWCLEAMDAHGGWIASAVDLVRFASAFDVPDKCPLLKPETIKTLFARPAGPAGFKSDGEPKEVYYACGWSGRPAGENSCNSWHTGALDGTSTLLVRRHDGLNWAALFNYRQTADGKELAGAIDPLIHRAAGAVDRWPESDQFGQWL